MKEKYKCPFCQKHFINNYLKQHLKFHHLNEFSNLFELEKLNIKICCSLADNEILSILQEYDNGENLTFIAFNFLKKTNINLKPLIIASGRKLRTPKESHNLSKYKERLKNTTLKNLGVDNPSKLDIIKEKKNQTFLFHFNYKNNFCNKEIHEKAIKNFKNRSIEEKEKSRQIYLNTLHIRYGENINNVAQIDFVKQKIGFANKENSKRKSFEERKRNTENARKSLHEREISWRSNLEIKIEKFLNKLNFKYQHNIFINGLNYDFIFNEEKIILEIQGTFFHASPLIYKENDLIFDQPAKKIWEHDLFKKTNIENLGYKMIYLWEHEISKMNEKEIEKFLIMNII